jgi:hypothetical protein
MSGRTEEKHEWIHNVWCRGRDINPASPGYEFHASVPEPPFSGLDTCLFDTQEELRVMWPQIMFVSFVGATGNFSLKTFGLETVAKAELVVEQYYVSNETCCATLFRAISFIMTSLQVQQFHTKVTEVWNVKRFGKFVYHFAIATGFRVSRV